jgi:hypothetical protein
MSENPARAAVRDGLAHLRVGIREILDRHQDVPLAFHRASQALQSKELSEGKCD